MSVGHAFQHVLEIGEGLDVVELAVAIVEVDGGRWFGPGPRSARA